MPPPPMFVTQAANFPASHGVYPLMRALPAAYSSTVMQQQQQHLPPQQFYAALPADSMRAVVSGNAMRMQQPPPAYYYSGPAQGALLPCAAGNDWIGTRKAIGTYCS